MITGKANRAKSYSSSVMQDTYIYPILSGEPELSPHSLIGQHNGDLA